MTTCNCGIEGGNATMVCTHGNIVVTHLSFRSAYEQVAESDERLAREYAIVQRKSDPKIEGLSSVEEAYLAGLAKGRKDTEFLIAQTNEYAATQWRQRLRLEVQAERERILRDLMTETIANCRATFKLTEIDEIIFGSREKAAEAGRVVAKEMLESGNKGGESK